MHCAYGWVPFMQAPAAGNDMLQGQNLRIIHNSSPPGFPVRAVALPRPGVPFRAPGRQRVRSAGRKKAPPSAGDRRGLAGAQTQLCAFSGNWCKDRGGWCIFFSCRKSFGQFRTVSNATAGRTASVPGKTAAAAATAPPKGRVAHPQKQFKLLTPELLN
jgi:hypothetical protein